MTRIAALVVAAALLGLPAAALADPPSPDNQVGKEILGLVPTHNGATKTGGSGGGLVYHGGAVVHADRTVAIYWDPANTFNAVPYDETINRYLNDVSVASAAGSLTNVYSTNTQYSDGSGTHITYNSSFLGSYVDTAPIVNGCTDTVAATTACVTDTQLRTEIARVLQAHGLAGPDLIAFIFTPRGVGSCYSSSSCAFSSYCAYHSNMSVGNTPTLYANQPYTETARTACGSGQSPNGNDADSTINVVSHEHNEAITDPFGTAWYDRRGYENGDKCAWTFGSPLGTTSSGAQYNQLINNNPYYLQQEWSNATSRCVLRGQ